MGKETRVVLGIILSVVFIGLKIAARSSRNNNRYPTYNSPTLDYQKLERERMALELAQAEQEARANEDADQKLRASLYAEHCQTDQSSELQLEIQTSNATFNELSPMSVEDLIPEGTRWPKATKVAGLEVRVLHKGTAADARPGCLDSDAALVKRVRGSLLLADAHGTRVDGALVVKTADSSAAQYMLASDVKTVVGGKGPVVAFVGSDNLAVFADGADIKSVRAAARASATGLDVTADLGCSLVEPMVLNGDTWSKWTPGTAVNEDVQAHRRAVTACLGMLLQDSFSNLAAVRTDLGPFPPGSEKITERRFDAKKGAIVKVSLDRLVGPQLVVQGDVIELAHNDGRRTPLSWPAFQRATKKALTPVSIGGKKYAEAFLFDPELAASLDTATNETLAALK